MFVSFTINAQKQSSFIVNGTVMDTHDNFGGSYNIHARIHK